MLPSRFTSFDARQYLNDTNALIACPVLKQNAPHPPVYQTNLKLFSHIQL